MCSNQNRGSGFEPTSFCCQVDGAIAQGFAGSCILPGRKPSTFTIPSLNIERLYYRPALERDTVHCNTTRADCTSTLYNVDTGKSPSFERGRIKSPGMNNTGTREQGIIFRGEEKEKKRQWAQMLCQSRIVRSCVCIILSIYTFLHFPMRLAEKGNLSGHG